MLQVVLKFAVAVADHWFFWFGGIVLVVFELVKRIPACKEKAEKLPISIFWGIAAACLIVAMFQAWKEENERADKFSDASKTLSAQKDAVEQKNRDLTNQLIAKDRPIILLPTPNKEIETLLKRQDQELARLKDAMPSPKKKALQLSADLLRFLDERSKVQPQFPTPQAGMTREQYVKQQEDFSTQYTQWMNETASEERNRFAVRNAEVMQDMKDEKIDTTGIAGMCEFYNGNTFGIQECATRIGLLAQKLSR